MKIRELSLLAFGQFHNRRLEFPDGLVVIYGANEAGKSTALRAIRALLYGIDEKTPFFTHMTSYVLEGVSVAQVEATSRSYEKRAARIHFSAHPLASPSTTECSCRSWRG